jgi:hypothetical protein
METAVLHDLGLVRSDELPVLAARWLAYDLADTESVRMLAGEDPHDVWLLEGLLKEALGEANVVLPSETAAIERIAVEWVTETWRTSGDTLWAVRTLARLGETHLDFDLGLFIGLDDKLKGGWGRLPADLMQEAEVELEALLQGK